MNKYRVFEAMEDIDDRYLAEADRERKEKKVHNPGRIIAVAACAAVILSTSVAAAAGLGAMDKIAGFFSNERGMFSEYDRLPAILNPLDYATDLESGTHPLTGTASFAAATCSDHFVYAMVEYAVEDEVLAALPEGASLTFDHRKSRSNLSGTTAGIRDVSLDENILTVMIYEGGAPEIPEVMSFTLRNLGYWDENHASFTVLKECEIDMTLNKSEVSVIPPTQALNTSFMNGIEFKAEITPLGILLSCDHQQWDEKYGDPKTTRASKEIGLNYMQFYLKDGTVIGDGMDYSTVYGIFASEGGWVDFENNREYRYYGFNEPIDIETIDKITLRELEFDF